MSDIPHLGFIVAAYAVTAVVLAAVIFYTWRDGRVLARKLAKLEAGTRLRQAPQRNRGNLA